MPLKPKLAPIHLASPTLRRCRRWLGTAECGKDADPKSHMCGEHKRRRNNGLLACVVCGQLQMKAMCNYCRATRANLEVKCIYLVTSMSGVKIGISFNPERRLEVFQSASADRLALAWSSSPTPWARTIEALAHRHFAAERVHSEWFRSDVAVVRQFIEDSLVAHMRSDGRHR